MAKQTIEIEVPDGKKAIWKDGCIKFVPVNPMEQIKQFEDAYQYLKENNLCSDLLREYEQVPPGSYSETLCGYRIVVAALTANEPRHLTTGDHWFPVIQFCLPEKVEKCWADHLVGYIESEGQRFAVVGGASSDGTHAGLGFFLGDGTSQAWTSISATSVPSKEVAKYISRQFGQLLFEVIYGGVNCTWKWCK